MQMWAGFDLQSSSILKLLTSFPSRASCRVVSSLSQRGLPSDSTPKLGKSFLNISMVLLACFVSASEDLSSSPTLETADSGLFRARRQFIVGWFRAKKGKLQKAGQFSQREE